MNRPPVFNPSEVLRSLADVRVGVLGDFCVDAYWEIDPDEQQTSIETGLPVRCVRNERYSLGGAGNVVANLIDLGVRRVHAVGLLAGDLFGDQLKRLLVERGAGIEGMVAADASWHTPVYVKPYKAGVEDSRLDFGVFNTLEAGSRQRVLDAFARCAGAVDVMIINQQFKGGLCQPGLIGELEKIIAAHPRTKFIVDSRDHACLFTRAILKLNAAEAGRILEPANATPDVPAALARSYAQRLSERTGASVFLTRGEHGIVVAEGAKVAQIPGIQILSQTDSVGAGDTAVAALSAALGAGRSAVEAATLANIAASITVRKLQITGTATPAEIVRVGATPDYVYAPELATDQRQSRFAPGTEIEIVDALPERLHIQHAIFDHDGTLSVLREGWELIMQPMMVRAVLGPRFDSVDPATFARVTTTVKQFIDKTTGIQTLVQMQGLVELVRQFGFVPKEQVLDEHGYKRIYNDELLKMVQDRMKRLQRGELESVDFQIKNAGRFLRALHERGVKLYLASGTDEADVIAEAEAMGYAQLFEGRIFGAVGDVNVEAKKIVLERIMRDHNLQGHQLVTFGDGPVEMRETRKRDGVCVGLASDEVRRFGANPAKRTRLIRAGAGVIIPDFSQMEKLLELLRL